jgi:sugar phosphate isomerase/epimerase
VCLPGQGAFDFAELLKRLSDVGFDGPLLLEPYTDGYGEVEELKKACDYLDELLYKMNLNEK